MKERRTTRPCGSSGSKDVDQLLLTALLHLVELLLYTVQRQAFEGMFVWTCYGLRRWHSISSVYSVVFWWTVCPKRQPLHVALSGGVKVEGPVGAWPCDCKCLWL